MKYLKYALYAIGAVVVIVGAILAYVAATFDPNAYKVDITRVVRDKTGRTLTIEGNIRLTFFPKIGVSLGATRLSEFGGEQEFAGLDDLRVSLALIALLSKQIVVDEVMIDGLRARLVRKRDGQFNFDDLLAKGERSASTQAKSTDASPAPAVKLDIEGVRIRRAAFIWKDEQAGTEYTISDLSLTTGRLAPGIPTGFELAANVNASAPKIDLRFNAAGTLDADLEQQKFRLKALKADANGNAANVTGLKATLSGDVEAHTPSQRITLTTVQLGAGGALGDDRFNATIQAPRIVFEPGALAVEQLAAALSGNVAKIELSEASLVAPRLDVDLGQQRVQIERLALKARGRRDADQFELKLDAPQLSITPAQASGTAIVAVLKAQGPQLNADARVQLSAVEGSAKALKIAEVAIDLDARQAQNAIKGRLATPLSANLETRVIALSKIGGQFEVRSPALPMKATSIALAGNAAADLKREIVRADLKTKFDESTIQAKLGMQRFAKPRYTFDIAIDRLNVDRYTAAKQEKTPAKQEKTAAKPSGGEQKEAPFDLSALKNLDLDGSVRVGELVASKVKASNVRIDVKAANGKVEINPLSANLYQGSAHSVVGIDANQNRFALRQNLTGVSVGPLLRDALEKDLLEGRGDIGLDVTAAGSTVSALTRTLTGVAKLGLKNGAIKGINLAQSLRSAKDMLA
ncbi:MAG: AsmA family protein, partial [Burkholderiales bacterium]